MDFWTRLIGGVGSQKRQTVSNNPQQRLARFKRIYGQILQTWQKSASLATDSPALETIRVCFQRLTSILHDESRSPAPHLCLSFAASSRIYTTVSKIGSTAHNEGVVREAVAVFAALIDSEEEEFLANEGFAQSLMTFVGKISGSSSLVVGEDTEGEVVELLFGIAAKVRLEPEILPVWFSSRGRLASDGQSVKSGSQKVDFAGITQKDDFPLCYQLIDHVHHEGRIGDFARTGLLYIFESASKSPDLEQWIVESDLPTLMASGLGALYSQLSRKLSIIHPEADMPLILKLSDYARLEVSHEADSLFSPEFKLHMDTFISYLTFWQDVLEHCRSLDVKQTLIDHFQILFLQQLLYPSMLESSDIDGGSSVAVLTYLREILKALDHPELVRMILHYLLALPDTTTARPRTPLSPIAAKRRMSLLLVSQPEDEDDRLNPSLFNLVDLILSSAQSINPQTVIAGLRLTSILLEKQHHYAIGTLLKVYNVNHKESQRTVGALKSEMELYLALANEIGCETGLDEETYETLLRDVKYRLECHPCSLQLLAFNQPSIAGFPSQSLHGDYFSVTHSEGLGLHYVIPDDPLMKSILELLSQFFTNDVETNICLTEAIVTMGSCVSLRLESWLSVEPSKYQFGSPSSNQPQALENQSDMMRAISKARRRPAWTAEHTPSIMSALQTLRTEVQILRSRIQDFDRHVASRRHTFHVHDELNEAMQATPLPPPRPSPASADIAAGTWTPQIPKHVREGTISPTRARSPRGRKEGSDARHTSASSAPSPAPSSRSGLGRASTAPSRAPSRAPPSGTLMTDLMGNVAEVADSAVLKQKIKFPLVEDTEGRGAGLKLRGEAEIESEEDAAAADGTPECETAVDAEGEAITREVTLSHVLTNVVILQDFVLEVVALMQLRASLFAEVKFA